MSVENRIAVLLVLCCVSPLSVWCDDSVIVSIDPATSLSSRIAPNFIAFSIEVFAAEWYIGSYPAPTRPSFVQLIRQLQVTPDTTTIFRIGGDSADTSVFVPNSVDKPPSGITYNISVSDIQSLDEAMKAVNGKVTVGVNFRLPDNATLAISHVSAIAKTVGFARIDSIEIGNEVDFYGNRDGRYNYTSFKREWNEYVNQLYSAIPSLPLTNAFQGMSLGGSGWFDDIADYIKTDAKYCTVIAVHGYGSSHCNNHVTTLSEMLSDHAATLGGTFSSLSKSGAIDAAKAANIPIVLGEGNSISCHGSVGNNTVEVSYATALWSLHVAANAVLTGLHRFHFHHGVPEDFKLKGYSSFVYLNLSSNVPTVLPLYYGMRLFALFSSHGATMVSAAVTTTNDNIKAFAAATSSEIRLLIIHKDLSAVKSCSVQFNVSVALKSDLAHCIRLSGTSLASPFGLTLAGQTYDGSQDGRPIGEYKSETINATPTGSFTIFVEPLSAVLCSLAV